MPVWRDPRPTHGAIEGVPRVAIRAWLRGWLASLHDIRFGSPPLNHAPREASLGTPSITPAWQSGSTHFSGIPVRAGREPRLLAARLRLVVRRSGAAALEE
jgi:hypothetical protein